MFSNQVFLMLRKYYYLLLITEVNFKKIFQTAEKSIKKRPKNGLSSPKDDKKLKKSIKMAFI